MEVSECELAPVFGAEKRLKFQLQVELALLKTLSTANRIPKDAHEELSKAVNSGRVTLERVCELEEETGHGIKAMVKALAEQSEEYGQYVHYGATSQDINDTVLALQLKEAKRTIMLAAIDVRRELTRLAKETRALPAIGRTHGQHAAPVTMGLKFANFLYEMTTAHGYMQRVKVFSKFSGSVGTHAALGDLEVEARLLKDLGLTPAPVATQVLSRLHMSDFVFACCALSSAAERVAKELRALQRTEIDEVREGRSEDDKSKLPQKRVPLVAEKICGLARVVRSQMNASLETIALEHERDSTNIAVETFVLPSVACYTHHILRELRQILADLVINEAALKTNLDRLKGRQVSERVVMALAAKVGVDEADALVRAHANKDNFGIALKTDSKVTKHLSAQELDALLDAEKYVGCAPAVVDNVVKHCGVDRAPPERTSALGIHGNGTATRPAASSYTSSRSAVASRRTGGERDSTAATSRRIGGEREGSAAASRRTGGEREGPAAARATATATTSARERASADRSAPKGDSPSTGRPTAAARASVSPRPASASRPSPKSEDISLAGRLMAAHRH